VKTPLKLVHSDITAQKELLNRLDVLLEHMVLQKDSQQRTHVRLVLLEVAVIEKQRQHQKHVQVVTFAQLVQPYAISSLAQLEAQTPIQVKVLPVHVPL